ncbi:hypothetical protein AVEN_30565-1 [Araneus ventricosus]|uniref:Uncharacterized protein n=1 Tax=Araneus ventricosus TaxID=182803 RepID=A0A4Y2H8G5_ARAVE|nr:hypothetical protein AVEN_30565-1 [Araneus ventricosus]
MDLRNLSSPIVAELVQWFRPEVTKRKLFNDWSGYGELGKKSVEHNHKCLFLGCSVLIVASEASRVPISNLGGFVRSPIGGRRSFQSRGQRP